MPKKLLDEDHSMIHITEVKIYPFEQETRSDRTSALLAYADITIEKELVVKGFKIFRSKSGGLFVRFPSSKGKSGQYFDQVIALTKELNSHIRDEIVAAYKTSV